jgi:hypothetical protein
MHLFPPRYIIHLKQELARQAAIAGACVIMTPEMNTTVQSLMATGHNLIRTEHPESLEHRCRCRKRKHKLLRQVQRRNERQMSRMFDQPVGPRIRTCQCPNRQLKRLTHSRLQRSTIGEPRLAPVQQLRRRSYISDLAGPGHVMTVDRDYQAVANISRIGQHYLFSAGSRLRWNVYHPVREEAW